MNYFIFKDQVLTIFLSMSHLTSVNFDSKIYDYIGGTSSDFKIYELNKKRSIVFEAKKKGIDRNFITYHQKDRYHFSIKYDEKLSNKDIVIQDAKECQRFKLIKETKTYQLFECPRSMYFVNKEGFPALINDQVVDKMSFISKGPPIYRNGELIFYKGVTR